ncbi:MAG TPA: hypothetical protein ENI93_05345 [Gammaproteobacteria bacterium]|nr:hypothetical protein [Gammaproteobacteria bacterium]
MTIILRIILSVVLSTVLATALAVASVTPWIEGLPAMVGIAILSAALTTLFVTLLKGWWFRPLLEMATAERAETDDPLLRPLAERLTAQARRIDELGHEVGHLANDLSFTASDIFGSMEKAENSIARQQQETEQVATAMNEMTATVEEVARNAAEASGAAHTALEASTEGLDIARVARQDIEVLVDNVGNASQVISQLEEESSNIGVVLDVIKGIAEQTNLLALNAAIEAARAGEQGRGFAVVADEVRTLASRTQESTQEIEEMISRLQAGVRDSVNVMQVAVDKGQEGSNQVGRTLQALNAIQEAVNTMSDMNSQIATAAEEQTAVANEINQNVVNIKEQGAVTARDAGAARLACEKLADFSNRMQDLLQTLGIQPGGLDLSAAKAAHLNWKTRLRAFLDGKEALSMDEAVSHRHCKFGKWYYSEGLANYGNIPAMREVERPHEELHEMIRTIIEYKERGQMDQAEQAYQYVSNISDEIVRLMDEAERQAVNG